MKELDENDVSVFQSLFVRGVLTLPLLVSLGYRLTGHVMAPFDHNMKWIVLSGVCASCALLFNILSVTLIPLSEAAILNDAYPGQTEPYTKWVCRICFYSDHGACILDARNRIHQCTDMGWHPGRHRLECANRAPALSVRRRRIVRVGCETYHWYPVLLHMRDLQVFRSSGFLLLG